MSLESRILAVVQAIGADIKALISGKLETVNPIITGSITEDSYAISDGVSVDINPANGSIQTWTLGANRTPTASSFSNNQSITLMVDDGSAYSITWTTIGVTWKTNTGTAPILNTSGYTVIILWKVGGVMYGARVGDA